MLPIRPFAAFIISLIPAFAVAADRNHYVNPLAKNIAPHLSVVVLPFASFQTTAIDNMRAVPELLYPDSLLRSDAALILASQVRRSLSDRFMTIPDTLTDSLSYGGYSILQNDTTDSLGMRRSVQTILTQTGADLAVIPYAFTVIHYADRPAGWRKSISYEQPVKTVVTVKLHLQIYDKNGLLLREIIREKRAEKPFAYDMLKDRLPQAKDPLERSAGLYAPAPLKALGEVLRDIFSN